MVIFCFQMWILYCHRTVTYSYFIQGRIVRIVFWSSLNTALFWSVLNFPPHSSFPVRADRANNPLIELNSPKPIYFSSLDLCVCVFFSSARRSFYLINLPLSEKPSRLPLACGETFFSQTSHTHPFFLIISSFINLQLIFGICIFLFFFNRAKRVLFPPRSASPTSDRSFIRLSRQFAFDLDRRE